MKGNWKNSVKCDTCESTEHATILHADPGKVQWGISRS